MEEKPIKIIHIISSLEKGGAQGLLLEIIQNLQEPKYCHLIISLKPGNAYQEIISSKNIKVVSLNMNPLRLLSSLLKILRTLMQFKPNIIQSWMYHADFLTIMLRPFFNNSNIIWSFHHADPQKNKMSSILIAKVCSRFSSIIPVSIIACSDITKKDHIKFGYSDKKIVVIDNGVDINRFTFKPKLPISIDEPVIGFIGRWHQIKGHETFIKAAKILSNRISSPRFIMIGSNLDDSNYELVQVIKTNGLGNSIELYGEEEIDIRKYYQMMDIYICSSWSESFSLTIVESALEGIPIISTDVGIVRDIVSDGNLISEVGDSEAIAKSVIKLLDYKNEIIEAQLKDNYQRAKKRFSLERMLGEYKDVYSQVFRYRK